MQEVDNAVNQTTKEVLTRYDFKGSKCTVELDREAGAVKLVLPVGTMSGGRSRLAMPSLCCWLPKLPWRNLT